MFLVADAGRGICAILLGDNGTGLKAELAGHFPAASLVEASGGLDAALAWARRLIEAPDRHTHTQLDARGTAFQQRVWRALREIPAGSTMSYSQIAQRIGSPSSVRAVAGACAANALAVAIPCHRVVRADGALSGYRWGIARKSALLKREKALV